MFLAGKKPFHFVAQQIRCVQVFFAITSFFFFFQIKTSFCFCDSLFVRIFAFLLFQQAVQTTSKNLNLLSVSFELEKEKLFFSVQSFCINFSGFILNVILASQSAEKKTSKSSKNFMNFYENRFYNFPSNCKFLRLKILDKKFRS